MTFKDVLRYKNTDWPTDVFTSPGHVTVGEVLCLVACSCCDVCYHGNITQEQLHLCRCETSRVDGLWHWGNAINSLGGNSMHWGGRGMLCSAPDVRLTYFCGSISVKLSHGYYNSYARTNSLPHQSFTFFVLKLQGKRRLITQLTFSDLLYIMIDCERWATVWPFCLSTGYDCWKLLHMISLFETFAWAGQTDRPTTDMQ